MNGDCNICINRKLPSDSASCVECGLLRKNYTPMSMPSRICLICRKLEFPNATLCTEIGWICPECAERIKRMIYKGNDDG